MLLGGWIADASVAAEVTRRSLFSAVLNQYLETDSRNAFFRREAAWLELPKAFP